MIFVSFIAFVNDVPLSWLWRVQIFNAYICQGSKACKFPRQYTSQSICKNNSKV